MDWHGYASSNGRGIFELPFTASSFLTSAPSGGEYVVDEFQALSVVVNTCGDGFIDGPEECDDMGLEDGDGCSAVCEIEDGVDCVGEPSDCFAITTPEVPAVSNSGMFVLVATMLLSIVWLRGREDIAI